MTSAVTRRYVTPLFEIAQEKGLTEQIGQELAQLQMTLALSNEINAKIADPLVNVKLKTKIIEDILDPISPFMRNFVTTILIKKRVDVLHQASGYFNELTAKSRGETACILEIAVNLPDDALNDIKTLLEKRFATKLNIETKITPSLIGGIRVRIGNILLDSSIKHRLIKLKGRFAAG